MCKIERSILIESFILQLLKSEIKFNVFEIFKETKNDKFNHLKFAKKKGEKFLIKHMEDFEKAEEKHLKEYVN